MSKCENRKNKSESSLVTKESICATVAMFSLLAFVILCTRAFVFGGVGLAVHCFLTGLFGYLAYPLCLGAFYLSATTLIGKRFVKNRRIGTLVALAVVFVALVVHTATTYSWQDEGYIASCFYSAEQFPKTAPAGWFGGIVVFCVRAILSRVGAIVLFSALAIFCVYLGTVSKKKKIQFPVNKPTSAQPSEREEKQTEGQPMGEIPVAQVIPTATAYPRREEPRAPAYTGEPVIKQRPGVSLVEDENKANEEKKPDAYSPFGATQTEYPDDEMQNSYERSRAFLFGGTPAENYRKNLLFDPNARVNQKPSSTGTESGYTPSYSSAYENDMNAKPQTVSPTKVVSEQPYGGYSQAPTPAPTMTPVEPIQPIQPIAPTPAPSFERTEEKAVETPSAPVEENVTDTRDSSYRRHEYMDYFSTSNPRIFGDEAEDDAMPSVLEERSDRGEREARGTETDERDGLHLLDDDPYTLRSDYEEDRSFTRGRDEIVEDRGRDEVLESRGRDEILEDRGRDEILDVRGRDETPAPAVERTVEVQKPEPPKQDPPKPRIIRPYVRISLDDLDCRDIAPTMNPEEVEMTKQAIIETLEDFKISGASIASVTFGPTVTRYNVTIPRNISPRKVVALDQSIALSLYSSGVNIYPNPENGVVSIEVPNKNRQFVQLGCMLSGDSYVNAKSSSLMFTMGKDVANRKIYGDITKMIHLLVAGSSGSGKSVFLGSLIISLIHKYSPEELRLILIDPKKTEFVLYNNLPHLMINEIITDASKAVQSLNWAIGEMNRRYTLFEQMSRAGTYVVNLDQYNEQLEKNQRLPKIVIIIDELADLMLAAKKEMEDRIQNLTQKARAAGIHLIVATQRPSTDVITGVIKSNLPTRVAFYVATDVDSRVILDQTGAQKLLGKGDFLYTMPGIVTPARVQSAFISTEESQKVVNFIKANNEAYYDEEATNFINSRGGYAGDDSSDGAGEIVDPMYIEALKYVILSGSASISMIQRKCSAGYNRAGKIIEWMEDMGYISPFDGAKARKVLITKEEFETKYGPLN